MSRKTPFCFQFIEVQLAMKCRDDYQTDLTALQSALAAQNLTISLLFKHTHKRPVKMRVFSAFNVDPAFGDVSMHLLSLT